MDDRAGPVLETNRLVLRPRRPDDAGVYRRLWLERDPRVPPHRRVDADGRPTVSDLADGIRAELREPRPALLGAHRRADDELVGYCGLVFHGNGAPDEPELAFELLRAVQGRGLATEAGAAVIGWAAAAGHQRLWATVRAWNVASRRVLDKLGFQETGRLEADALHGDSLLTVLVLDPVPLP